MKRVVVHQSNYVPWRGFFDLIHDADLFVFYDEVQYTKNDWRNRNRVRSANGTHWLTIPIAADAVKLKISEVEISSARWRRDHWKTIEQTYRKAPFFKDLDPFRRHYADGGPSRLVDVNRALIREAMSVLGIRTELADSRDFRLKEGRVERLLDLLEKTGATEYLSGPSGRDYLAPHEAEFERRGIRVRYKDYSGYPEYAQCRAPFDPAVSVLDLIANAGAADAPRLIWGWRAAPAGAAR